MIKKIGDGGIYHISYFGLVNYYDHETKEHKHGYGLRDIIEKEGQGLRFHDTEALRKFLRRNPRIQINEKDIFMILEVVSIGDSVFVIVEYDEYVYTIYAKELKFTCLYDKKACEFHKRLL